MTKQEIKILRRDIKRANRRLAVQYKQGLRTSSYRYVQAQQKRGSQIYGISSSGSVKFRSDLTKLSNKQIRDLRKSVSEYLETKTSTKIGIEEVHKKAFNTLNDNLDTKISFNDYLVMWEYANETKETRQFSSDKLIELFTKRPEEMTAEELKDFLLDNQDKPLLEIKEELNIDQNETNYKREWKSLI